MALQVTVDASACSGHGDCVAAAPGVFALEETAMVIGVGTDEEILAAAESCPALAITVIEPETGDVVFP